MNFRDQRQTIALILVGVGVLWLLVSLGAVAGAFVGVLARYWPVLLIGVGVDILVRRRPFGLPYTGVVFAALLVFSLFSPTGTVRGDRFERTLSEPVGAAREANVHLDLGSVPVSVTAAEAGDDLLRANIRDSGEVRLQVRGDTSKTLLLEKRSNAPRLRGADKRWDVALTGRIPLALAVDGGSGPVDLDLSGLNLREAALDLGSGPLELTLPATPGSYKVDLEGGSGGGEVNIAAGAQVTLQADLGSGATRFVIGEDSYVTLNLDYGSGPVTVETPAGANIKLDVQDSGSGRFALSDRLVRVGGGRGKEGTWQTRGFDPGGAQIILKVEDAGSGALTIR